MIKDGMWFKNEEHYLFYLQRMEDVRPGWEKAIGQIFDPLIKKAKKLLNEQN